MSWPTTQWIVIVSIAWLRGLVAELPRKPVLVAHSMGAIVCSYFISKYPEAVAREVVLLSPVFRTRRGKVVGGMIFRGLEVLLLPFSWRQKHRILASRKVSWIISHYLTADRKMQKMIDEEHYKYSGTFSSAQALLRDVKISSGNEVILPEDKRVLVIFGKKDQLTSWKLARERVEGVEGVEYFEIEGTGHLINYERPGEVAGRIAEFLG